MVKKGQADIRVFIGLVIIMVGTLAVSFIGLGFMFNYSALIWAGSVVLGVVLEVILLVLIILNLVFVSILAFLGKKNLLLIFAVIEAILGFLFPLLVHLKSL